MDTSDRNSGCSEIPCPSSFRNHSFRADHVFSFITLPVEINASKRALVWLSGSGITTSENHDKAADALKWAAYTYVVAALGSLATLLYYIMIFMGGRNR